MNETLRVEPALEYVRARGLRALVIARAGEIIVEEYDNGFRSDAAHPLYSGTKSFWGVAALRARDEGLLALDEPVAETIDAWRNDPWKRQITPRMLLSMTAGFGFGGLGASVPTYDRALGMPLKNEPGTRFTYSGISFQAFGGFLARKLARMNLTPHEYLRQRVLDPAGVAISSWRRLADGTLPLPTGAFLRAVDWLAYARFVLHEYTTLAPCFEGSTANDRYGLGWWLAPSTSLSSGVRTAPSDLVYASGSAGQGLYLTPSRDLAIVHVGKSSSYRHEVFLRRLFGLGASPGRSTLGARHTAAP